MKNFLRIFGFLLLGACRTYDGPVSDHFDGTLFYNPWAENPSSFMSFMKWRFTAEPKSWPAWVDNNPNPAIPGLYRQGNVSVTFINHASFLIEVGGVNILSDPVFSERTSPVSWAGPKRVRAPGLPFEKLPKIDAVLISHNHYDHMDLPTLKRLSDKGETKIFVPLGDKEWLEDEDVKGLSELDWWDTRELSPEVKIHFAPAQHWSARGIHDRNRSLWGSFLIEYKGKLIYISGDTGYGPHFRYAKDRFPEMKIELALLPIGAYEPRWFMRYQHMDPEDSVMAYKDLDAQYAIGMHFGCWQLTDESIDEPEIATKKHLKSSSIPEENFVIPEVGGTYRYSF